MPLLATAPLLAQGQRRTFRTLTLTLTADSDFFPMPTEAKPLTGNFKDFSPTKNFSS